MGPAVIPSGGEEVRVLYSWKRRLEAIELAMICVKSVDLHELWWRNDDVKLHAED